MSELTIYLNANQVKKRYGNLSEMGLHGWLNDEVLDFPQPVYFNRRRFWRVQDLDEWDAGQASNGPPPSPPVPERKDRRAVAAPREREPA